MTKEGRNNDGSDPKKPPKKNNGADFVGRNGHGKDKPNKDEVARIKKILSEINLGNLEYSGNTLKDIFGFSPKLEHGDMTSRFIRGDDPAPKRNAAMDESRQLQKLLLSKDYTKFDAEFKRISEKYGRTEQDVKRCAELAEAYNELMEELMSDKSTPVYRFMNYEEFSDLLASGEMRTPRSANVETADKRYKSFTLNAKHKAGRKHLFGIKTCMGNHDFKLLKATGMPRADKTLKNGQFIRPHDLSQQEVRLDVTKGQKIHSAELLVSDRLWKQ